MEEWAASTRFNDEDDEDEDEDVRDNKDEDLVV